MPISDIAFTGQGDPFSKLTKLLGELSKVELDAQFIDQQGKIKVTRDLIEMVLSEYAQNTQNTSIFNKFLGIDTKLDKALKEYKAEIQIMISGLTSMGQAQQTLQAPIAGAPGAGPMPAEAPGASGSQQQLAAATNQAQSRSLPVGGQ
jgi:hypothetical protein